MVNRLAEQSAAKLASSSGEALNSVRLVPVYGLANFVVGQGPCDPKGPQEGLAALLAFSWLYHVKFTN